MAIWTEAPPEVISIAEEMIRKYHPRLAGARIAFVMRDKATKSQGRRICGEASKISAKMQTLIHYHFMIWLAEDFWSEITHAQRLALVDHELSHCRWNEWEETAEIVGHDIEEFVSVIERHGLWSDATKNVARAVQQLPLEMEELPARGKVGSIDPALLEKA
jgi:hypothetical protein